MSNQNQVFNIIINSSNSINNTEYFKNLYDNTSNIVGLNPKLQLTVNFDRLLNSSSGWYEEKKWRNELVARLNAVCIKQNETTGLFYYLKNQDIYSGVALCNNFNFNENDIEVYNLLLKAFYTDYIYQNNPELVNYDLNTNISDSVCQAEISQHTQIIISDFGNGISSFLQSIETPVFTFVIIFVMVGLLIFVAIDIVKKLEQKLKR